MAKDQKVEFKNLLSPIKVGPVEYKNRIALAPMNETMSGPIGEATEQMLSYYGARAKGGAGLIFTGAIMATKMAAEFPHGRNLYCYHQGHMQGLMLLTERVHYFGSKIAAQMTIGFGRQGHAYDHSKRVPAPTAGLPYENTIDKMPKHTGDIVAVGDHARAMMVGTMTREMSIEEIRHEQKEFAESCQLAVLSGFDMIEIHAPHGYLVHQFLSPFSNRRTDMYGGEWRNRKRFLNEIMEQIRYACPGVAVGVRMSAEEHMEGGLTEEEMIDLAQDLEARGADYISLSDGGGYDEVNSLVPDMRLAKHLPEHGEAFKKALSIPVTIASQHDPVKADANIAAGKFDISALGRQLLCDPEYPNKVAGGSHKEIVRCERCNTCLMRYFAGMTPVCKLNKRLGREYAFPEYQIGEWQEHESVLPEGMARVPMPALDRPWWKQELDAPENHWRKAAGRAAK